MSDVGKPAMNVFLLTFAGKPVIGYTGLGKGTKLKLFI